MRMEEKRRVALTNHEEKSKRKQLFNVLLYFCNKSGFLSGEALLAVFLHLLSDLVTLLHV